MKSALGQPMWDQAVENLQNLGFSYNQASRVLLKNVAASKYSSEILNHHFNVLQSLGFKTEEVKQLVTKEPKLLGYDAKLLKRNLTNLLKQLGDRQGQAAALQSPQTLIDNIITTNEKIDYCIMEMVSIYV
jgi:Holliday junction resolvasome RuvABC DNA-binding subunit